MRSGRGGANLVSLGYDADIEFSSRIDSAPVLPVYRGGALVLEAASAGVDGDAEWAI